MAKKKTSKSDWSAATKHLFRPKSMEQKISESVDKDVLSVELLDLDQPTEKIDIYKGDLVMKAIRNLSKIVISLNSIEDKTLREKLVESVASEIFEDIYKGCPHAVISVVEKTVFPFDEEIFTNESTIYVDENDVYRNEKLGHIDLSKIVNDKNKLKKVKNRLSKLASKKVRKA